MAVMTSVYTPGWRSKVKEPPASERTVVSGRPAALDPAYTATGMPPSIGGTFTVVTVGQSAERLPAAVLLHDCVVP